MRPSDAARARGATTAQPCPIGTNFKRLAATCLPRALPPPLKRHGAPDRQHRPHRRQQQRRRAAARRPLQRRAARQACAHVRRRARRRRSRARRRGGRRAQGAAARRHSVHVAGSHGRLLADACARRHRSSSLRRAPQAIKFIVAGTAMDVLRVNTGTVTKDFTAVCAAAGITAKLMTDMSSNITVVIRFTDDDNHHQLLDAERFGVRVLSWLPFLNWLDANYDVDVTSLRRIGAPPPPPPRPPPQSRLQRACSPAAPAAAPWAPRGRPLAPPPTGPSSAPRAAPWWPPRAAARPARRRPLRRGARRGVSERNEGSRRVVTHLPCRRCARAGWARHRSCG